MAGEQEDLEKEIRQFQKSLNAMNAEDVSLRRENVAFYEFCQANDIRAADASGGWSPREHQKFAMLLQQHKALPFEQLYARIKPHFPSQSRQQVKRHHEWYRLHAQHIATNKRMKSETRARHKMQAKQAKSRRLIERSRNRLDKAEKAEKAELLAKTSELHRQMDGIETIRKDQQLQQSIAKEKEAEELRAREMEKTHEWNARREKQKRELDGFYSDRIAKLERLKQEQEKQRQLDKMQKRERGKINAKRVEYRETKRDEKLQKRNDALVAMEQEQQMKEARLAALRMSVKRTLDQDKIANIGGLLKDTQNAQNRLADAGKLENEMFGHHGYSDQQLFRDPRFELMTKLISSDLHRSKYAKQCLKNTSGAVKPRKDCAHSDLFKKGEEK